MSQTHDAIVIGTGQAGPALAVRLAKAGRKVAIIERGEFGGTCVNNGCIPTKALVASARAAHVARHAADWGVNAGPVSVDMRAVKARKDRIVQHSIDGLDKWLHGTKGLEIIRGHARFTGPHAVDIDGRALEAPQIFINVGGRATRPDWPGLDQVGVLDNASMMAVDFLPEHLIVIGGSYIGLEFAQMYRRFGAKVTVLEYMDRLIAREDGEVSNEVQKICEREGVEFHLGVRDGKVTQQGGKIGIQFTAAGKTATVTGSHVLAAVGRRPNTDDLGLDTAGIATDKRGYITVDDELRTSVEGVYALGDVNGRGAFTHTAWNDYEIVAANLLDGGKRRVSDRIMAYALFTDPPLGRVGMTEDEVRKSGKEALVATMPMTRVGRARERGETQGFMKVLVDAQSEQILGAALLCIEGDEIVHTLIDLMTAGAPYKTINRAMHIHPTVSELLPTLLEQLKPLKQEQKAVAE
jgi:pyruvate/2-oxoglutarate dehydrogenase complex dihydrolipoamide dehydrogenase (E3) component